LYVMRLINAQKMEHTKINKFFLRILEMTSNFKIYQFKLCHKLTISPRKLNFCCYSRTYKQSRTLIMARWLTVRLSFDSQQKERHFSSSQHPDSHWTSENFLVIECKASFPRIKRPKPDTSHSSLSRSEIKNTW